MTHTDILIVLRRVCVSTRDNDQAELKRIYDFLRTRAGTDTDAFNAALADLDFELEYHDLTEYHETE